MTRKIIITIIILITLVFVVLLVGSGEGDGMHEQSESVSGTESVSSDEQKESESEFERFADIELTDYDGNTVTLEEYRGKPLVINSWAVWCPFCVDELPDFAELQQEFDGEVVVIGIDRQEPVSKVKDFTDELGITDDMVFLLDSSDAFYKRIGGFSMPETIFVNSAGEIVVHKRGPMELEEMREHTQKILDI